MERRVLLSATLTLPAGVVITHPIAYAPYVGTKPSATTAGAGSTTPSGYTPTQVRSGYGIPSIALANGSIASGAGTTIALVDAYDDPTALGDLEAFDAAFGLANPPSFAKVNQQGATSPLPGTDPSGPAEGTDQPTWETEESLDIEWAHVMAPQANLVLVEANSPADLFTAVSAAANYPGVDVVSMSFSTPEFSQETSLDSTFTTPAGHTPVTFVAATGDSGAFAPGTDVIQTNYPAASPNVVAVGGTSLVLNGGTYISESAWGQGMDSGTTGGGGGGISPYEAQPAYQSAAASTFTTTQRTTPDVSMIADPGGPEDSGMGVPIYDSYDFGSATPWAPTPVGGTSLATPVFGGVISLADQIRTADGLSSLDGPTQTLPDLYKLAPNNFHDIISGSNGFPAGAGYDLATGLGSPVGNLFATSLATNGIGDLVFNDANADGIQDAGDAGGVSGVTVELFSVGPDNTVGTPDDVLISSTTTNASGIYQLPDPTLAGNYYVHFVLPNGFTFSPEHAPGSNANNDSDVDPNPSDSTFGDTAILALTSSSAITNIDAGMYQKAVTINDVSLDEGNSGLTPFVFTVTVSPPPAAGTTVTVPYTTVDGTATVADNDYHPTSGTLTFTPTITQQTITVEVVGDTKPENNETFSVVLTEPAGYVNGSLVGVGTILNDDFPTATVSSYAATRLDALSQNFPFTVTLNETAAFAVSIPYFTVDNTAVSGIDFQATSGTLVIPAGQTTGTVNVVVLGGVNPENNKTFFLGIGPSSTVLVGTPAQGAGTIITNFPPGISIADSTLTEPLTSAVAMMPFVVSVEPSQATTTTVTYATADGTAVAGTDYAATSGTLTFPSGQVQQTVYVPVYRRFSTAGSLTFTVNITAPGSTLPLYRTAATGTIVDPGTVTLPFGGRQRASYTDYLNNPVNVSLRGPGTGQVVFLGSAASGTNAYEILLNGTNAASTLVVSTRGGSQTPFQNIVDTGSLGGISGRGLNLLADLTIAGSLNSLQLDFVQGATLNIGPGAGSLAINLGRAIDTAINSAIPISSLTADAYLSTDGTPATINAPSVGPIHVKESFGGTVVHAASVANVRAGDMSDVSLIASVSIGNVTADTITGSTLFAGVEDGLDTLPTAADQFTSHTSRIGAVKVMAKASNAFSNTLIAGWSVGAVKLGSVQVADNGTPFGVTGNAIASVTTTNAAHLSSVSAATPSLVDEDFTVEGV